MKPVVGSCSVVLSRSLHSDDRARALEDELAERLVGRGVGVLMLPHLYHLRHGSELWQEVASLPGEIAICGWLNPRPIRCLVEQHVGREATFCLDLGALASVDDALETLAGFLPQGGGEGELRELTEPTAERWYPVLDCSRCTFCGHCLQFCLFGVYERDEQGRVIPVKPDNCKPGCPACSRVCPQGAIIFPLSDEPAIAGAPGTLMQPDAAARRMYHVRTGLNCPVCGEVSEAGNLSSRDAPVCEECGRPLGPGIAADSPVHAEIDALIDSLDRMAGGEGE